MSKRTYVYWMTQRPPMPGAMPAYGLTNVHEYEEQRYEPTVSCMVWAKLTYNRELKPEEVSDYELIPAQYTIDLTRAELYELVGALDGAWNISWELHMKLKDLLEG